MKKRALSAASLILLIAFEVLAVVSNPFLTISKTSQYTSVGEVYLNGDILTHNFIEVGKQGILSGILIYTCMFFGIVGIVAMIIQLIGKHSKVNGILTYSPIISTITLIIFTVVYLTKEPVQFEVWGMNFIYTYSLSWVYFVILSLLVIPSILCIFVASAKSVTTIPISVSDVSSESDPLDSLLKYKNLLGEGIITQEEFDAKKKQLLDL